MNVTLASCVIMTVMNNPLNALNITATHGVRNTSLQETRALLFKLL